MTLSYSFQSSRDNALDQFSQGRLKGLFTPGLPIPEVPGNRPRASGDQALALASLLVYLPLCYPASTPDKQMPPLSSWAPQSPRTFPCYSPRPFCRNAFLCLFCLLKFSWSFGSYAICQPFLERFSQSGPHPGKVWGAPGSQHFPCRCFKWRCGHHGVGLCFLVPTAAPGSNESSIKCWDWQLLATLASHHVSHMLSTC